MVLPPSLVELQTRNIDTLERRLAYAAMLLKASYSYQTSDPVDQRIKITTKKEDNGTGLFIVEATLNFDNKKYFLDGGRILGNLIADDSTPAEIFYFLQASQPEDKNIPPTVKVDFPSLEEFFVYYAYLFQLIIDIDSDAVIFTIKEDTTTGGLLKIALKLPYNNIDYNLGLNIVSTVYFDDVNVLDLSNSFDIFDSTESGNDTSSDLSNNSEVGNNSFVAN